MQQRANAQTYAQLFEDLKTERARAEHWRAMAATASKDGERQAEQIQQLTRQVNALTETIDTIERGRFTHHARPAAKYYVDHWQHGVIQITHGEQGYSKTSATQAQAVELNAMAGNTRAQVLAAEACSMFSTWGNFEELASQSARLTA
jgi:hypothetical protein